MLFPLLYCPPQWGVALSSSSSLSHLGGGARGHDFTSFDLQSAWRLTIIMFWLQAAEEGNDYGFFYLLEFSTRATEQLWLKRRSIYIVVFLSQVFLS